MIFADFVFALTIYPKVNCISDKDSEIIFRIFLISSSLRSWKKLRKLVNNISLLLSGSN